MRWTPIVESEPRSTLPSWEPADGRPSSTSDLVRRGAANAVVVLRAERAVAQRMSMPGTPSIASPTCASRSFRWSCSGRRTKVVRVAARPVRFGDRWSSLADLRGERRGTGRRRGGAAERHEKAPTARGAREGTWETPTFFARWDVVQNSRAGILTCGSVPSSRCLPPTDRSDVPAAPRIQWRDRAGFTTGFPFTRVRPSCARAGPATCPAYRLLVSLAPRACALAARLAGARRGAAPPRARAGARRPRRIASSR